MGLNTVQFFMPLVSQQHNLLRCSYMKGGVTLGNVLFLSTCLAMLSVDRKGLSHIL